MVSDSDLDKDLKNTFLKLYYYYHFDFYKIYRVLEDNNLINFPYDLPKIYEVLKNLENQIDSKILNNINGKEGNKVSINNLSLDGIKSKVKFFWEEGFLDSLIFNDYPVGVLFYEGDYSLLSKNYKKIAIVGSRKPENKTIRFIESFFEKYSDLIKNFVVVSGLAVGVDSLIHKYSLDNNIKTIAVLGNGIFYYYPSVNKELQLKISKKGLLLAEYPDNISPKKYYFPYRNRIISLISDIVVVFQASEKSGSIITGRYALEFGKELIVPFLGFGYSFSGSKKLINSGGKLISSIDELAEILANYLKLGNYNFYRSQEQENNKFFQNKLFDSDYIDLSNLVESVESNQNEILENLILEILSEYQELSINEINQKLKENNYEISITNLVSILSKLELLGKIESKYGSIYRVL